jgi:S1-C subfamily serine protease
LVDNQTDVAALVPVSSIDATALSLASSGDAPAVWLARLNGALGTGQLENTRAGAVLTTTIDEPVDDTTYTRHAFRVAAALEHGDSGAPVVDGSGRVTGMMFATSRDGSAAAYAVAADDIHRTLDEVRIDSPSVDTGRCN